MSALLQAVMPGTDSRLEAPGRGVVGVLGGMGPLATVDFLRKLVDATPAKIDQDHVPVVVSSIPQVPSRTAAYRGEGASPLPAMVESGRRLLSAGAELLVMPCNTAHLWFDDLQAALGVPMLHLVDVALDEVVATIGSPCRVGLLSTDATLASGLYPKRAARSGRFRDLHWELPTAGEMLGQVMPGVEAVKAGDLPRGRALLCEAARALVARGAQGIVLGCTEIPLVLGADDVEVPLVDATAVLARRAGQWSRSRAPSVAA
jgi:aspartate racemase